MNRYYCTHPSAVEDNTEQGFAVWRIDRDHASVLNQSGVSLWRWLRAGASPEALAQGLADQFAIAPELARSHTDSILEQLIQAELIHSCEPRDELAPAAAPTAHNRINALRFVAAALAHKPPNLVPPREDGFWEAVAQLACHHRVAGLIFAHLPPPRGLPEWVRARFSAQFAAEHERNGRAREQLEEATAALNRVGIEPLLLKGAAHLAAGLYPQNEARAIGDIDLMVPASHMALATEALEAIGYRADRSIAVDYDRHHHSAPLYLPDSNVPVELHRAPVVANFARLLPTELAWQKSQRLEHPSLFWRVLDPTRQVLLAIIHAQLTDNHHAHCRLPLREMADVARMMERHRAINWHAIEFAFGRDYGAALASFLFASHRLFGTPLPMPALRRFARNLYWWRAAAAVGMPVLTKWNRRLGSFSATYLHRYSRSGTGRLAIQKARLRRLGEALKNSIKPKGLFLQVHNNTKTRRSYEHYE